MKTILRNTEKIAYKLPLRTTVGATNEPKYAKINNTYRLRANTEA